MNTRFLATFRAVAEAGSLAAAARRLNLANASVSEQIRALERELNATLLIRRGRGLVLTNAGQAVLEAAGEVLARVEDLRHRAQLGQPSGMLRVGSISTALITLMPAALRLMAERHPRIELKVLPGTSTHLYAMLERGELDCALTVRPHFDLPKSLGWRELRREPLTLIAPPWLEGQSVDELLMAAPFIGMDREAWTGRIVNAFLKERRLQPRELFELDAQEAVVIMVAQGLGTSLLPDWGIAAPAGLALRKIPVGDWRYDRSLGLVSHRGPREALAEAFSSALTQSLQK
ncbi:LysR family transcriptional regulator [Acetobacteraceae bacterium H6797]|nr:LysR family transcriptional regulator [Acetobacteraceae bacterium H6797]